MSLFIKQKVVKSYAVEVAGPCLVDCQFAEFQMLSDHVTVLTQTREPTGELPQKSPQMHKETGAWLPEEYKQSRTGIPDESAEILAEAEAEAQAILAKARQEAAEIAGQIRRQAEEEVARRREALEAEVRAEVMARARKEGFQAGLAEGEALVRARQEEAQRLVQMAKAALRSEYARVDQELLQLALKIAERIVRGTLAVEPQRLLDIARSLAIMPQEREHMILHVSPEDGAWLNAVEAESLPCPWVVDETLRSGECFLESEEGIFSARLELELEKFEKILREELRHGGLDQPGPQS